MTLHRLLLLLSLATFAAAADRVKVTTYFETKCPDSRRFVVGQLDPVYRDLRDIMDLDLNIYGKAEDTPWGAGYNFTCQHGPVECEGNMMLACAKNMTQDVGEFQAFITCIMSEFVGAEAGEKCATQTGLTRWSEVEKCYKGVEGQQLLHQEGVKQGLLQPPLDYVPWILIDDVFSYTQLALAQLDLRGVVCDAYQGPKPDLCP